jgi:hypothetical protein
MSTPGTMKTSGKRRNTDPVRPPATPTAGAATKTAAWSPKAADPSLFAPTARRVAEQMKAASQ